MKTMFAQGQYTELKAFCKTQLEIYDDDVDILFYYASSLEALGEHEAAQNFFTRLFNITKDRLFLICSTIPEFQRGKRKEALAALDEVAADEDDPNKLLYAFKIAVKNGEPGVGSKILYKSFHTDPKLTVDTLQVFFEEFNNIGLTRERFLISVLDLLRELSK